MCLGVAVVFPDLNDFVPICPTLCPHMPNNFLCLNSVMSSLSLCRKINGLRNNFHRKGRKNLAIFCADLNHDTDDHPYHVFNVLLSNC